MTYYPDLSEYVYTVDDQRMLNVGWLSASHAFPTGAVEASTMQAILLLCESQYNIMRGVHDCEFCDQESPLRVPADVERGYVSLGMGELRVKGVDGLTYAAPSLIYHYIEAHRYLPPSEFLAAVGAAGS